jgi:lipopolysaccharide/colanic/teichoic acid biosynthesis glycosyltransferase
MKRIFDIVFSLLGLLLIGGFLALFWVVAAIDTGSSGLFVQERIGQFGNVFKIYKLRTLQAATATISPLGAFFRKTKIDELPQLWNVLIGDMSFVGPRPDIAGYYDLLEGENRKVLELKPGLTSAASIKYYNEDKLLALQENPVQYNDEVLFPDKVKMNLEYYYHHTFFGDSVIIFRTVFREKKFLFL